MLIVLSACMLTHSCTILLYPQSVLESTEAEWKKIARTRVCGTAEHFHNLSSPQLISLIWWNPGARAYAQAGGFNLMGHKGIEKERSV